MSFLAADLDPSDAIGVVGFDSDSMFLGLVVMSGIPSGAGDGFAVPIDLPWKNGVTPKLVSVLRSSKRHWTQAEQKGCVDVQRIYAID